MHGRRRGAPAPAHAPRRTARRGTALVAAGGLAALAGAVLLATTPASAEAGSTTATLTLLGIRDSNCNVQTGGTTAYVAPGGDVKFKGELTGVSITVPVLGTIPVSSAAITSFNYRLVVDGDTRHPHAVNGKKTFTLSNVSGNHDLAWTASSVDVTVPVLDILGSLTGHKSITVPLNGGNVGLPAGGKLKWVGKVVASKNTKCGIAQVPGGEVSVGPITLSIDPITDLPSQPGNGLSIPNPIGGGGGGSSHPPTSGGGGSSHAPTHGGGSSGTASPRPTSIPEIVVPNAGGGGDSAFGGGIVPVADAGGNYGPIAPIAVTSTAPAASSSSAAPGAARTEPVELATGATDDGIGGAALPVLLAIVAIIALALVTATYARMYLIRKPPAA